MAINHFGLLISKYFFLILLHFSSPDPRTSEASLLHGIHRGCWWILNYPTKPKHFKQWQIGFHICIRPIGVNNAFFFVVAFTAALITFICHLSRFLTIHTANLWVCEFSSKLQLFYIRTCFRRRKNFNQQTDIFFFLLIRVSSDIFKRCLRKKWFRFRMFLFSYSKELNETL